MSSNVPPPYDPSQPQGQPEYLAGDATPPPASSGRGRKAVIGGAVAAGLVVIGGGAWAASWYLSSGPTAAGVLPEATVAFAQVNLDPSGEQKVGAVDMLNKFPAFKATGIGSTDDLREKVWGEIQSDGTCGDVDYADDIEPWLGDRIAAAAVDAGGDEPVAVAVLEVTDEGRAADGLDAIEACSTGDPDDASGYVISDGWAYVADTEADAQKVVDLLDDGSLADDADFKKMTDAAGGDGVVTAYAAPAAGKYLSDLSDLGAMASGADLGATEELAGAGEDFAGLALQVRFADGGLEVEYAGGDTTGQASDVLSTDGVEAVTGLPDGTAAALGAALEPGWADAMLDQIASAVGTSREDLITQAESTTGLTLPDDLETLLGSSFAVAVSGDLDVDAIVNSPDPSQVPAGVRVLGDADGIEGVLDTIRSSGGLASLLQSTAEGDTVGAGPDADWNAKLAEGGSLGDSDTFTRVVPDGDKASVVLYLDADANDGWLDRALTSGGVPAEVTDNVEPLEAFGFEGWLDGGLVHGQLTLTTD